jgi:hypothetical protein
MPKGGPKPAAPKGAPTPQADATPKQGMASRFKSGLGNFAWQANSWNDFFRNWMPGITVSYKVKAQGAPGTPTRDVLHLALAAVFGMSVSRRVANLKIQALVNHNLNYVEVVYSVNTVALEYAYSRILDGTATEALEGAAKTILNNITIPGTTIHIDPSIVERITSRIYDNVKDFVGQKEAMQKLQQEAARGDDLDNQIIEVQKKLKAQLAQQLKEEQELKDKQSKDVNPPVQQKAAANKDKTRGINVPAVNSVTEPWLAIRNVVGIAAGELLKVKVAKQVDKLTNENGPKMLFELAPGQVFSGPMPWSLAINNKVAPFTQMMIEHAPGTNNPLLTRATAENPQLPQAMGVDLKTLVAQVLFDPGTMPPPPRTHAGPPTTTDY